MKLQENNSPDFMNQKNLFASSKLLIIFHLSLLLLLWLARKNIGCLNIHTSDAHMCWNVTNFHGQSLLLTHKHIARLISGKCPKLNFFCVVAHRTALETSSIGSSNRKYCFVSCNCVSDRLQILIITHCNSHCLDLHATTTSKF